jgi:host factor-I protein
MDVDSGGIQNEFFNKARKDRTECAVLLTNGERLVGRVVGFDRFTILLDTGAGERMVFKHAIATVGSAA